MLALKLKLWVLLLIRYKLQTYKCNSGLTIAQIIFKGKITTPETLLLASVFWRER